MGYGTGANGKSTFLTAIEYVLGEYAHTTDIRTFTTGVDSVPYELAQLAGRRLIMTSEARTKSTMNEQVLKNFTGGEKIEAQHKYGHPFSYKPIGKIWFAVNHPPRVHDESHGFWRRVRMIPFERTFSGSSEDRSLSDKLRAEGSGILSWAVQGCMAWRAQGLNPPLSVTTATEAYQQSEDPIAEFINERCVVGTGLSCAAGALYEAYRRYAADNGLREHERLTGTAFGKHVARMYSSERTSRGRRYLGLGIVAQDLYSGEESGG
jgi:putative DNA primase/helicase